MLYLYGITESPSLPQLDGLGGAPLEAIDDEGLFAVVSEHDELPVEASEGALWTHEEVVEVMMDDAPVLPMRFGSVVADEAVVRDTLRRRRPALEEALERVRGAVELSVRVAIARESLEEPDTDGENAPGPGTAYLVGRLKRLQRQRELAARIHEPLTSIARSSTSWSGAPERPLWKAAYLVPRDQIEPFMERVRILDDELSEATVVCTGPWPPYSFSSGDGAP